LTPRAGVSCSCGHARAAAAVVVGDGEAELAGVGEAEAELRLRKVEGALASAAALRDCALLEAILKLQAEAGHDRAGGG
jgi:hypothetical protein